MTYLEQSLKLIILQYSDKPNALAEMTNLLSEYQDLFTFFEEFIPSFDIDQAWGDRLDLIGKMVGFSRTVSLIIDKKYFGFEGQTNSLGFGQAPFYRHNDARFTDLDLNDTDYQFYLKAKIIKNNIRAVMAGKNSIVQMLSFLFYPFFTDFKDNKDMTITLWVFGFDSQGLNTLLERISIMQQLDLMPLPQGVRIKEVITL